MFRSGRAQPRAPRARGRERLQWCGPRFEPTGPMRRRARSGPGLQAQATALWERRSCDAGRAGEGSRHRDGLIGPKSSGEMNDAEVDRRRRFPSGTWVEETATTVRGWITGTRPRPCSTSHALARGDARLAEGGALVVDTGRHTGRSPKAKFVVREPGSEDADLVGRRQPGDLGGALRGPARQGRRVASATRISTSSTPSPGPTPTIAWRFG